jgi:uncharacterized oxidoreductase
MTSEFLPLLRRRKKATLVQVSSGLAFVPLETAPIYSATKAAVHSFCLSLRAQLRETGVRVVELIPPVVETNLHDGQTRRPPRAMKLEEFVKEAMQGLAQGREEINVGMVKALRVGARVAPGRFQRIINKGAG